MLNFCVRSFLAKCSQIREAKEAFNEEVLGMKTRKEVLLQELEEISLKLIDIQYRLDATKRKPVPTIPVIYPEERHTDPFFVRHGKIVVLGIIFIPFI